MTRLSRGRNHATDVQATSSEAAAGESVELLIACGKKQVRHLAHRQDADAVALRLR